MKTLVCLAVALWVWAVWSEYRIQALEIRLNVHEASEHWQETPEKGESR